MEWDSTLLTEEDDSLLQPTPTRLTPRISPLRYLRIPEDSVKDNCLSSSKDASNKENISVNKSEGPKLNMEPVRMKKKRRGGGYNLRKSLAWDREFFTEEGVLDPQELSMISGIHVDSSREGLSTINEDDSLSNDYGSTNDTADLQALEKNLFKEVPTVSLKPDVGTLHLPPKHNSPACGHRASTSAASPKVIPTRSANKTGSGTGGCPRPLPLSSLKRLASTNACRAATKESKLSRIPVSKPGHSSNSVTKKGVTQGASHVKQKQTIQTFVNIQNQRNVAPKSSPKSLKHNQNKPKDASGSLPAKASVLRSKRTVVKSPIYPNSSTHLNPAVGNKVTNTDAKVIRDDPSPSIVAPQSECKDGSTKLPAYLPRGASITTSPMQHTQLTPLKPSGLRMPSPSLGFFGQPKPSVSHSSPQRAVEADTVCLRKPGYLRPPRSSLKIPEVVNNIKQTVDTAVLRSGSDLRAVSHERMKQNVQEDATDESLKISNEDGRAEPMNDGNVISGNSGSSILGCMESRISTVMDWENDESLPWRSTMNCAKGVSRTRSSIEHSLVEHGDILESSNGEAVIESSGDEQLFGEKGSYSNDSQNLSNDNLSNADFKTLVSVEIELKSSGIPSQGSCSEFEKSLLLEDVNAQSQDEETELQMTSIISIPGCKNNLYRCSEDSDLNNFSGKSLELESPYLAQSSQNNHGLAAADTALIKKDSDEYIQEVPEKLPVTTLDVACKSELGCSGEISQLTVGMNNESFHTRKMVGEALLEHSSQTSSEIASSVENHNCSLTRYLGFDVNCSGEITASCSHSAMDEGSESLATEECGTFNRNKVQNRRVGGNDIIAEEPENLTLFTPLDSEIADLSCGSLLAEIKFHVEDQNGNRQAILEVNSTTYGSSEILLGKSNLSQTANLRQIYEHEEIPSSSNILQVENEVVQELDCNLPVECCINNMQVAPDQFKPVVLTEKSGEAGFPNFCMLVGKVPQINGSLLSENCLSREITALEELERNADGGVDAVPRTINARGGKLESSSPVSSTPHSVHIGEHMGDEFNDASYIVHTTPGREEVEPSSESYGPFTGSWMKRGLEHGVEDMTSSRNRIHGASRLKKSTLLDETKAHVASDTDNLADASDSELEATLCLEKYNHTSASIKKSECSSSGNSVTIIPPINAVPFSDEWLAAMEAAGEDILKIKSGAVQNSPTDKYLPEPSPWSPVRRKNNSIGPFDCTKFTNNFSSESQ